MLQNHLEEVRAKSEGIGLDITKVRDVQQELQRQSLGLETQMKQAGATIDTVLEGVRKRGIQFIESNLTPLLTRAVSTGAA
jgi:hypothetical protein